jgi:hypothetical protein
MCVCVCFATAVWTKGVAATCVNGAKVAGAGPSAVISMAFLIFGLEVVTTSIYIVVIRYETQIPT